MEEGKSFSESESWWVVFFVGEVVFLGLWKTVTNLLLAGLKILHQPVVSGFDRALCRHHCRWRNNIFFIFENLFLLDRRCWGCSGCSGILCMLWTDYEEDEFFSMRDYLVALLWWSNNLWYPIELTSQSNNDTMGSRLIDNMTSPHIWLTQNNIKNIKRSNIAHYLILEGLDAIGQVALLADTKISSLVKPPDVVWLHVWCCRQPQLEGLSWDEVLLAVVINNEMQWCPLHPHLWMDEALPLFKIYWFFWLNCCDRESGSGVCVDDLTIFNNFWIGFRIRVRLRVFDLDHQLMFRVTFISVVPGKFLEVTPLPSVIIHLPFTLFFLCLGLVV